MSAKSVLVLLRIPFSVFLLPIVLFGLLAALHTHGALDQVRTVLILISVHLFLYPASNAFNSYYDRDTGPIGGIAAPPAVSKGLLRASLTFDAIAVLLGLAAHPVFGIGLFIYGLFSKAYSWDKIRWKRRPVFSLVGIALVQGSLMFWLTAWTAGSPAAMPGNWWGEARSASEAAAVVASLFTPELIIGALTTAFFLMAVYPLTQIYQHEEDAAHGDMTYSRFVGVRGTFVSTAVFLLLTGAGFGAWFALSFQAADLWWRLAVFAVSLAPALVCYAWWWTVTARDPAQANFSWMMRMNVLASGGMNIFLMIQLLSN